MLNSTSSTLTRLGHHDRGFTLIEIMVVVAIVGILAAVALPSYTQHILKSHRVDAKNALLDLAAREEKFFAINNKYSSDGTELGYGKALPFAISASGTSYYDLSVATTSSASKYAGKATPTGGQKTDTTCYTYAIDQLGTETNLDSADAAIASSTAKDCW